MRLVLAQLAPVKGEVEANLDRVAEVVRAAPADLAVFPELFLSGYRLGDRFARIALGPDGPAWVRLGELARRHGTAIAVGAPVRSPDRSGEVYNAALLATADGRVAYQVKRYLPTYGPFEEGSFFTPTDTSALHSVGRHRIGLEICYDAFFPEVSRDLAMAGADLVVALSAAPVTSRRLFDKVLPARAVENAVPLVYVNRVGVEDGVVFGGGSGAWDARGEARPTEPVDVPHREPEEEVGRVEIDLSDAPRWRRFRPTLRDLGARPSPAR